MNEEDKKRLIIKYNKLFNSGTLIIGFEDAFKLLNSKTYIEISDEVLVANYFLKLSFSEIYKLIELKNVKESLIQEIRTNRILAFRLFQKFDNKENIDTNNICRLFFNKVKLLAKTEIIKSCVEDNGDFDYLKFQKYFNDSTLEEINSILSSSFSDIEQERRKVTSDVEYLISKLGADVETLRLEDEVQYLIEHGQKECKLYKNRSKEQTAFDFIQEQYGKYLNYFSGCEDCLYQDELRKIDEQALKGLINEQGNIYSLIIRPKKFRTDKSYQRTSKLSESSFNAVRSRKYR